MQLLILFCLQIDLMNHFIFSEFTDAFPFIDDYMSTIFTIFSILIFTFSYYFLDLQR